MLNLANKKLILGSKSPRRSELLYSAGFEFEIRTQDADENIDPNLPILKVSEDLALKKAGVLLPTLSTEEILLTADSIVIFNDEIYHKPKDSNDALRILGSLSGHEHIVTTGVCLSSRKKQISFTSITYVTFDKIDDEEARYYIDKFKPYDKAGSYGIQDWIGLCKVNSIRGSYSNVMGLPIRDLYQALKTF